MAELRTEAAARPHADQEEQCEAMAAAPPCSVIVEDLGDGKLQDEGMLVRSEKAAADDRVEYEKLHAGSLEDSARNAADIAETVENSDGGQALGEPLEGSSAEEAAGVSSAAADVGEDVAGASTSALVGSFTGVSAGVVSEEVAGCSSSTKVLKTFERRKKPLKQFERRKKQAAEDAKLKEQASLSEKQGADTKEKKEVKKRVKKEDKEENQPAKEKKEIKQKQGDKEIKQKQGDKEIKQKKGDKEIKQKKDNKENKQKKAGKEIKQKKAGKEVDDKKLLKRSNSDDAPEEEDKKVESEKKTDEKPEKPGKSEKKVLKRPKTEDANDEKAAPVRKKLKSSLADNAGEKGSEPRRPKAVSDEKKEKGADGNKEKKESKKETKESESAKDGDQTKVTKAKRKNSEADESKTKSGSAANGGHAKKMKEKRDPEEALPSKREQESKANGKEKRENGISEKISLKESREKEMRRTHEAFKKCDKLSIEVSKGVPDLLPTTPASGRLIEGGTNKVREAYEAAKELKQRLAQKEETSSASMKYLKAATQAKQSNSAVASPLFMSSPPGRSAATENRGSEKPENEKHGSDRKQIAKSMDRKIALETFQGMLETLTRHSESISKVTSFAMECAHKGISKQVMDVIMRRLKNERENRKRVDLLFLVDSMAQYNFHKGSHMPNYAPVVEGCLARFLTAVAPPNSSSENYQQCVKVVNLWLRRNIMDSSTLKETIAKLGMEAGLNTTQRQYQRQDRAFHDPIREMNDMVVDEYGSNTGFEIPGLLRRVDEEDEDPYGDGFETFEAPKIVIEEMDVASTPPGYDSKMNGRFVPLPSSPPPSPPPLPQSPPPSLPSSPPPPPPPP